MNGYWLLLAPATPVLFALLWALPPLRPAVVRLAPLAPLPALVLALAAPDTELFLPWVLFGAQGVLDALARTFLGFTALLWLVAGLHGRSRPGTGTDSHGYWLFWLLTLAGNIGLILTRDIAGFYAAFALMTFAGYALVIHERSNEALRAGRAYLVLALVGEGLLLAGLLMAAVRIEHPLLGEIPAAIAADERGLLMGALLWGGFGVKAGVALLHMWLPLAHPVAPVPASAVLSGAMIKAGLLGWLLVLPALPDTPLAGTTVMVFGFLGAFGAALIGVCQYKAKTVLAYSSVSQMGLMTVLVGAALLSESIHTLLPATVALYALHHGLAKGALFLSVSAAPAPRMAPWFWGLVALPGLALAGLPLTSGAAAKSAMKDGLETLTAAPDGGSVLPGLLGLAAVGTTALVGRFFWCLYRERQDASPGSTPAYYMTLTAIAASVLLWRWLPGVPAQPETGLAPDKLAELLWPLLLGGGLVALALRARPPVPPIPAGDLLVPLERLAGLLVAWARHTGELLARLWWHLVRGGEQLVQWCIRRSLWLVRIEENWRHNPVALFVLVAAGLVVVLVW